MTVQRNQRRVRYQPARANASANAEKRKTGRRQRSGFPIDEYLLAGQRRYAVTSGLRSAQMTVQRNQRRVRYQPARANASANAEKRKTGRRQRSAGGGRGEQKAVGCPQVGRRALGRWDAPTRVVYFGADEFPLAIASLPQQSQGDLDARRILGAQPAPRIGAWLRDGSGGNKR